MNKPPILLNLCFLLLPFVAICQANPTKKQLLLPNQIDLYYPEQVRYYTAEYQQAIIETNEMISDVEDVLKDYTSKKKLKKKEKVEYELLTTQLAKLDAEKSKLTANMAVWAARGLPKGMVSFSQQYTKDKCYDLFTEDKIISKSEYDIEIQPTPSDSVSWYESAKVIKIDEEYRQEAIVSNSLSIKNGDDYSRKALGSGSLDILKVENAYGEEIQYNQREITGKIYKRILPTNLDSVDSLGVYSGTTIWVKIKNPFGQDSVFCLREIPEKYEKIITSPARLTCPNGFELSNDEKNCSKRITVARVIDALPIKVLMKGTRKEIYFIGFKEVPCN